MCSENGFLMDDGVVARLDEDTFLCHTTTGGADRIHAHMEDWLQCEWWDWKVYTANVTEQWAQVAVVGPKAREVLQALGGDMDLSRTRCPSWAGPRAGSAVRRAGLPHLLLRRAQFRGRGSGQPGPRLLGRAEGGRGRTASPPTAPRRCT
jgi:hypothetical protein